MDLSEEEQVKLQTFLLTTKGLVMSKKTLAILGYINFVMFPVSIYIYSQRGYFQIKGLVLKGSDAYIGISLYGLVAVIWLIFSVKETFLCKKK